MNLRLVQIVLKLIGLVCRGRPCFEVLSLPAAGGELSDEQQDAQNALKQEAVEVDRHKMGAFLDLGG